MREILKQNNWTVGRLADEIGVCPDTVFKWLSKKNKVKPRPDTAIKLLKLCQTPYTLEDIYY